MRLGRTLAVAAAPPPFTSSTLAAAGGCRRAKLTRLMAVGHCLLARPGAAGASPPSAARSPAGAARRPRTSCSSGGAGRWGGGPGTLDGWAAAGRLGGQIWELEPMAAGSGSEHRVGVSRRPCVCQRPWWSVAVLGWWQVWCGRLHLCMVRLMPAVRAEPSSRW
jgi:hypothetical protein